MELTSVGRTKSRPQKRQNSSVDFAPLVRIDVGFQLNDSLKYMFNQYEEHLNGSLLDQSGPGMEAS